MVSFKKYPLDAVVDTFWKKSTGSHWLHCDWIGIYFVKETSMYLVDTVWINCLRNHNKITMYLLDKCPLAPSERKPSLSPSPSRDPQRPSPQPPMRSVGARRLWNPIPRRELPLLGGNDKCPGECLSPDPTERSVTQPSADTRGKGALIQQIHCDFIVIS